MISKMWSKGGPGAWMLPMLFIRASFELYHSLPSTATAAAYCYDLSGNATVCSMSPFLFLTLTLLYCQWPMG